MATLKNSMPALSACNAGMLILLRAEGVVEQNSKSFFPAGKHAGKVFTHPPGGGRSADDRR